MREKYLVTEDSAPLIFFFEILISAFSLLGSKVVTTSITYCISISSAVTQKHSIDLLLLKVHGKESHLENHSQRLKLDLTQFLCY